MLLAIDPGNVQSAYTILSPEYRPMCAVKMDNFSALQDIGRIARDEKTIENVAIEMVACYGMPVGREVFDTCVWIGRFTQVCLDAGVPVDYVYRKDVKLNLCGTPTAKDGNIRQALIDRFARHDLRTGKGTKKNPDWFYGFATDMWAAYAVGVTYLDSKRGA